MTGLFFFFVVAIWFLFVLWSTLYSTRNMNTGLKTSIVKCLFFLVLLVSPLGDEIFGKYQFEALCKNNGIESANVSKARGKSVKVEYGNRTFVENTIIPIKESNVVFKDVKSGAIVLQYKDYYALGGWLMRYTWIGMGSNQPALFGGICDRRKSEKIFALNSITFLYK